MIYLNALWVKKKLEEENADCARTEQVWRRRHVRHTTENSLDILVILVFLFCFRTCDEYQPVICRWVGQRISFSDCAHKLWSLGPIARTSHYTATKWTPNKASVHCAALRKDSGTRFFLSCDLVKYNRGGGTRGDQGGTVDLLRDNQALRNSCPGTKTNTKKGTSGKTNMKNNIETNTKQKHRYMQKYKGRLWVFALERITINKQ